MHEPSEHLDSFDNGIQLGFRPQNPGPYGPNGRPLVPAYQGNNGVLVGPGGPTGIIGRYCPFVCARAFFFNYSNATITHVYAPLLINWINQLLKIAKTI